MFSETSEVSTLSSSPMVEVLVEKECFWIRNALTIEEQTKVFGDILERSNKVDNTQERPCMNPGPKTLIFNGNKSTISFGKKRENDEDSENDDTPSSVYDKFIIRRAISIVSDHVRGKTKNGKVYGLEYDRHSVGVIRYKAPNGSFPEHIDHCNVPNGWVFLLSLGCKARFSVQQKPPKKKTNTAAATIKETKKVFLELNSGDVLVFDPSTEAAILHGVNSILPSTCPGALVQAFVEEAMANHRYGVQIRTSLED